MKCFGEVTSKETCFSLHLEKENFLYSYLAIEFYYGRKKELISEEFLLPWKKLVKSDVVKHELRVESL